MEVSNKKFCSDWMTDSQSKRYRADKQILLINVVAAEMNSLNSTQQTYAV